MLVFITHKEAYGTSGGFAFKHAGEYLNAVALAAWRGEGALSRTAAIEFTLNEIKVEVETGRHAVDDAAYAKTVTLAESGETKEVAKSVHNVVETLMCWRNL